MQIKVGLSSKEQNSANIQFKKTLSPVRVGPSDHQLLYAKLSETKLTLY